MLGRPKGSKSEIKTRVCACGKTYRYGSGAKYSCDACKYKRDSASSAKWRKANPDYQKRYLQGLTAEQRQARKDYYKNYYIMSKGVKK